MFLSQDGGGKIGGVFHTGFPDCHAGDRYTARHLDDGVQGIDTLEVAAGYRYPDYRQGGPAGQNSGKMRGQSGGRDDDFDTAFTGVLGVLLGFFRGAVG